MEERGSRRVFEGSLTVGFVSFKGFEGKGIRRRDCRFFMWRGEGNEDEEGEGFS